MKKLLLKSAKLSMAVCAGSLLFSCNKQDSDIKESIKNTETAKFSNLEQVNLAKIGFDLSKTEKTMIVFPDNTTKEYYVYEDTTFPVDELGSLSDLKPFSELETEVGINNEKLHRQVTANAAGNRTYTIAFFDVNAEYQRQAVGDLIWRFNNTLNCTVQLRAVFAEGKNFRTTQRDIAVFFGFPAGGRLAEAEYAVNGRPGSFIRIGFAQANINEYNTRANFAELLQHEVGHSFGFNHSNEEFLDGIDVLVPGTSAESNEDSVMVTSLALAGRTYTQQDIRGYQWTYGTRPTR